MPSTEHQLDDAKPSTSDSSLLVNIYETGKSTNFSFFLCYSLIAKIFVSM
jgi:hypothetical protein